MLLTVLLLVAESAIVGSARFRFATAIAGHHVIAFRANNLLVVAGTLAEVR
jgi:hypothetical protein